MRSLKLICCALFVFGIILDVAAQSGGTLNNNADKSYLPNVTPPSPESFAITEYGKNGVSEYTGKLNLNVPIYNYKAGQLTLPVNLNYSGAGVKVNDIATWTGINWGLNPGGVINRRINDSPDESTAIPRKYINKQDMLESCTSTCSPNSQFYYNLSYYQDYYDTEVDIFNFSFNGYSGSFYLDENFNPIYRENEQELKIEILGNSPDKAKNLRDDKTFLITTPDGIKYYFGGNETEQTMVLSGNRGSSVASNSSFYLYKIEHPVNGTILLEYLTAPPRLNFASKSYTMTGVIINSLSVNTPTSQIFRTQINNPKRLSKIRSLNNSIEINFNSTLYGSNHFISSLDNIEIKNATVLLKKVNFIYDAKKTSAQLVNDFTTAERFFLKKIEIDKDIDTNGGKYEEYKMEYNDPFGLPDRLTNGQDVLGYYNGWDSNSTLIPDNVWINPNHSNYFANRSPNFFLASKGVLTKIIYPTKGFSTFEYETSPAKEKKYKLYEGFIQGNTTATIPGDNGINDENVDFIPIYSDQKGEIKISTGFTESEDPLILPLDIYQANHALKVEFKITDMSILNSEPVYFRRALGMNPHETSYYFDFIKGHIYKIEFKFLSTTNTTVSNYLTANFEINLFDGYNRIEGFGVRLKKEKNFSSTLSQVNNETRYYYGRINGDDNVIEHFPEITYMPKYIFVDTQQLGGFSSVDQPNTSAQMFGFGIIIYSESGNKYCDDANGEVNDLVSISYGGDNFENGGKEKYFLYVDDFKIERIKSIYEGCWEQILDLDGHVVPSGNIECGLPSTVNTSITQVRDRATSFEKTENGMYNGKLIAERDYSKINGSLFKTKEISYDYLIFGETKQATNFVGRTLFGYESNGVYCNSNHDLSGPLLKPLSSCYIGYYTINSSDFKIAKTITKEYIQPIPLSLYRPFSISVLNWNIEIDNDETELIEAQFKKITTTQTYEYGTLRGLPTKITSNTSDSAITNVIENKYVNQASSLVGITTSQFGAYGGLQSANNVATPIEVKQYQNANLLSTQRTLYKQDSNYHILPEIIQTAKGSQPLDDRAIFEEYDNKGNPTLVSLKDGTKTKYLYNANNQVIAKIENFTGTLNPNTTSISGDPCVFINQYANSQVTVFTYDVITNLLVQTMDSNCRKSTYIYDALHRLKQIKDHDGNVIKEMDNNYRPN